MDTLKSAVIGMGVLIVAMLALLMFGLSRRGAPPPPITANVLLSEPAGTHIASIATAGPSLALLLQGGGGDRVLLLAPDGRVQTRVSLRNQ
jgi:hypothetical protein